MLLKGIGRPPISLWTKSGASGQRLLIEWDGSGTDMSLFQLTIAGLAKGQFDEIIHEIRKGAHHIMSAITDFKDKVDAAFTTVNANLDNIVGDVANLNKQIQDLKAQLGSLSPADQAALDAVAAEAQAVVDRTKTVADATPDSVA